jgi:TrmH family RNA methyltransferase
MTRSDKPSKGVSFFSAREINLKKTLHPKSPSGRLRLIEGQHNSWVKELRQAFARGDLSPQGFFAIEGARILDEAIRSGLRFHAVFFSKSASGKAERLLPQFGPRVETLMLPDKLFASAVPSDSPQGVAALVHWKQSTLQDVLRRAHAGPVLVIAGIQDPGNLGTILRSAEAFGAAGVVLGKGTVSPLNPKVIRASAGSVFRIPVVRAKLEQALPEMQEHNLRLIATSSHKGLPAHQAKLLPPLAIFIGNEGAGLSRDLLAKIDAVAVPHAPEVESLNAAIAASIVLYEAAKQRNQS